MTCTCSDADVFCCDGFDAKFASVQLCLRHSYVVSMFGDQCVLRVCVEVPVLPVEAAVEKPVDIIVGFQRRCSSVLLQFKSARGFTTKKLL